METKNKKYWLGLSMIRGLGSIRISKLLKVLGDAKTVWKAPAGKLKQVSGIGSLADDIVKQRKRIDLNRVVKKLKDKKIKFITLEAAEYPQLLKEIYDPPPTLYYRGILDFSQPAVAVVGSRRSTAYGRKTTGRIASKLAQRGITVISGMARGIDTCGHEGALRGQGKTTAVLGSGLGHIYPPENKDLFYKIQENGLILSEFPPEIKPLAENFPRRNRIISGLSLGVLVVEASTRSGSLITANLALEQGREIFAIPGNLTRPQSRGTNKLIQKGAKLVTGVDDILEELFLYDETEYDETEEIASDKSERKQKFSYPQLSEEEENIIKILQKEEILHINEIINRTEYNAGKINTLLLKLELKGLVSKNAGKKYSFKGLQNLLKPI